MWWAIISICGDRAAKIGFPISFNQRLSLGDSKLAPISRLEIKCKKKINNAINHVRVFLFACPLIINVESQEWQIYSSIFQKKHQLLRNVLSFPFLFGSHFAEYWFRLVFIPSDFKLHDIHITKKWTDKKRIELLG